MKKAGTATNERKGAAGGGGESESPPQLYVGIGASAGGLEAIEAFFTHMPAGTGMAFIVVQHLSPDYKSLMVELLSKKTPMPVHRAEDGMPVLPNSVYLIPLKKNLTIFHGRLLLSDQDHIRGINLPIGMFLRSLAEDQADKAVAIISAPKREVRFWVSSCSTGEEAYSLAILTRECQEKFGFRHDVKIFATDIDRDAIHYAASGSYPESIAADISPRYLAKYFHKRGENFQIVRSIREMVVFAQHNLIKAPPFTNIDLLSCRNFLIDLQPVLQRKVMEFFNFSLVPGGVLFLGSSETTGDMSDSFGPLEAKLKIYRSRGRVRNVGTEVVLPSATDTRARGVKGQAGATRRALRYTEEERILERFLAAALSSSWGDALTWRAFRNRAAPSACSFPSPCRGEPPGGGLPSGVGPPCLVRCAFLSSRTTNRISSTCRESWRGWGTPWSWRRTADRPSTPGEESGWTAYSWTSACRCFLATRLPPSSGSRNPARGGICPSWSCRPLPLPRRGLTS